MFAFPAWVHAGLSLPARLQADDNPVGNFGEAVGRVIAWFASLFGNLGETVGDFFQGIAQGAGLKDPSLMTWLALGFGALLVVGAISGLIRGSVVGALIQGLIGLAFLSWAIS